jgi:hypothetical protein
MQKMYACESIRFADKYEVPFPFKIFCLSIELHQPIDRCLMGVGEMAKSIMLTWLGHHHQAKDLRKVMMLKPVPLLRSLCMYDGKKKYTYYVQCMSVCMRGWMDSLIGLILRIDRS